MDDELELTPPAFQAIVLMCDAVQVSDGKLFILGGGLSVVGPAPQPISIAARIAVPWDQANIRHSWKVELRDEDGQPVTLNGKLVALNGQFEAGRPTGLAPGSPLWVPLGINFGTIQLAGGRRYTWRLFVNDDSNDTWQAAFTVRGAPTG